MWPCGCLLVGCLCRVCPPIWLYISVIVSSRNHHHESKGSSRKSSKYLVSHYSSHHHHTTVLVVSVSSCSVFFTFQSSSPSWTCFTTTAVKVIKYIPVSPRVHTLSHHTSMRLCGWYPCSALSCPHVLFISGIVSYRQAIGSAWFIMIKQECKD
jgi:hypothetical protein